MHIRRSQFGRGFSETQIQEPKRRSKVFRPELGFSAAEPPEKLEPGFSPAMRNIVINGGHIRPRSGLSTFAGHPLDDPVVGGDEFFDVRGNPFDLSLSSSSVAAYDASSDDWSELSYAPVDANLTPSGTSRDYWATAAVYDGQQDRELAVFTNNQNFPKFWEVDSSQDFYSDFSFARSFLSAARDVTEADQRLVWFNVEENGTRRPVRVVWSSRGNPADYQLPPNGTAGFEDIPDMRGRGHTAVANDDDLVLFTDQEIWRGRATRDLYAFEFAPITRKVATPYENTITKTPLGIVFVGEDFEIYALRGNSSLDILSAPGREQKSRLRQHLKDVVADEERMFGVYNIRERRFELYFPDTNSTDGYPNRALYFHLENAAWSEQRFGAEITWGHGFTDPDERADDATWDEISTQWDNKNELWDESTKVKGTLRPLLYSSDATAYRTRSSETLDDGATMDVRWRSHGLQLGKDGRINTMRRTEVDEVWMEYRSDQTSEVSMYMTSDGGDNFQSGFTMITEDTESDQFFAPVYAEGRAPQFEVRMQGDGPEIERFQTRLRPSSVHDG